MERRDIRGGPETVYSLRVNGVVTTEEKEGITRQRDDAGKGLGGNTVDRLERWLGKIKNIMSGSKCNAP